MIFTAKFDAKIVVKINKIVQSRLNFTKMFDSYLEKDWNVTDTLLLNIGKMTKNLKTTMCEN